MKKEAMVGTATALHLAAAWPKFKSSAARVVGSRYV